MIRVPLPMPNDSLDRSTERQQISILHQDAVLRRSLPVECERGRRLIRIEAMRSS